MENEGEKRANAEEDSGEQERFTFGLLQSPFIREPVRPAKTLFIVGSSPVPPLRPSNSGESFYWLDPRTAIKTLNAAAHIPVGQKEAKKKDIQCVTFISGPSVK
jgi:hypothetical protein